MRALIGYAKRISVGPAPDGGCTQEFAPQFDATEQDCCVALVTVESADVDGDCHQMANQIAKSADAMKTRKVFVLPFTHLSPFSARSQEFVQSLFAGLGKELQGRGFVVRLIPANTKNVLFGELLLFEGAVTTRLRLTQASLKAELKSLTDAFGKELLTKLLMEEK